jgi:hypothetical protein
MGFSNGSSLGIRQGKLLFIPIPLFCVCWGMVGLGMEVRQGIRLSCHDMLTYISCYLTIRKSEECLKKKDILKFEFVPHYVASRAQERKIYGEVFQCKEKSMLPNCISYCYVRHTLLFNQFQDHVYQMELKLS